MQTTWISIYLPIYLYLYLYQTLISRASRNSCRPNSQSATFLHDASFLSKRSFVIFPIHTQHITSTLSSSQLSSFTKHPPNYPPPPTLWSLLAADNSRRVLVWISTIFLLATGSIHYCAAVPSKHQPARYSSSSTSSPPPALQAHRIAASPQPFPPQHNTSLHFAFPPHPLPRPPLLSFTSRLFSPLPRLHLLTSTIAADPISLRPLLWLLGTFFHFTSFSSRQTTSQPPSLVRKDIASAATSPTYIRFSTFSSSIPLLRKQHSAAQCDTSAYRSAIPSCDSWSPTEQTNLAQTPRQGQLPTSQSIPPSAIFSHEQRAFRLSSHTHWSVRLASLASFCASAIFTVAFLQIAYLQLAQPPWFCSTTTQTFMQKP